MKKEAKKIESIKKDDLVEENEITEERKNEEIEEKKSNKVLKVIKIILLAITSPVWFPWKVLFVRKESKKFRNVSTPKKIFRIVRSPITKPLKFMIFLMIIGIELVLVYKVRYSPVTYTFTRASVHNYYLKGETNNKLMGIPSVNAADVRDYHDELKMSFDYIDEWDLDSKNKMYVVLDADITKIGFKYMDHKSIEHVLNKFNTDQQFREDVKYIAKNVNKIISRAVKEFPEAVPYYEDFNIILVPATKAVSAGVDYRAILDIFGVAANTVISEGDINESYEADDEMIEMIDASIDMVIRFSKGASIKEAYEFVLKNYYSNTSSNNTVTSAEIIVK